MKKQIWFRPDQCDLTTALLRHCKSELKYGAENHSDVRQVACAYTQRQIDEILELFEPKK